MLDDCANRVKAAIGVKSGKIVFGGTSSQLIENLMNRVKRNTVICSKYEHDSFLRYNYDSVGKVEEIPNSIANMPESYGKMLVMWQGVNNITGEIFPVEQIGSICHGFNTFYICDMTAMIGKAPIPANIDQWCDCAVWSGHKLGTEGGIGAMWLSDKFNDWLGDFKLHGTPNLSGAMAITDATEDACNEETLTMRDNKWSALITTLDMKLDKADILHKFVPVAPPNAPCIPFALAINAIMFDDINADSLQQYLASKRIYIGIGGSACSSLHDFRVLNACGLTNDEASRVVRISFGDETTKHDIDEFINAVVEYKEKFVR